MRYASDGIGAPFTEVLARCLQAAASLVFLCLLVVLAKGWTITRGRLSSQSGARLLILMTIYTICYVLLFIIQIYVRKCARSERTLYSFVRSISIRLAYSTCTSHWPVRV